VKGQCFWSNRTQTYETFELSFVKGIVHIMKILSSFTHPHVVPNPYDFLASVKHKM